MPVVVECESCHYNTGGFFCQRHGGALMGTCKDWLRRSSGRLEPGALVEVAGPLKEYYTGQAKILVRQGEEGVVLDWEVPSDEMPGQIMVDFGAFIAPFTREWLRVLFSVIVALVLWACDDGCKTDSTRCNGNKVEVCDAEGDWVKSYNCDKLVPEGGWSCCWSEDDQLHLCLTNEECP